MENVSVAGIICESERRVGRGNLAENLLECPACAVQVIIWPLYALGFSSIKSQEGGVSAAFPGKSQVLFRYAQDKFRPLSKEN
jgi:hypothetical protein